MWSPDPPGRRRSGFMWEERGVQDEMRQLRIPGPTPVPPRVTRAAARPIFNHRGPRFHRLHREVTAGLKRVFETAGHVALLTGSGTAAMEAAVANMINPGDKVLVLVGGVFGGRWGKIARAFGAEVVEYHYDWSQGADPARVAEYLAQEPGIAAVFATHNESSTGVMNDIEAVAKARVDAGRREVLLIVDSVSGLGGAPLRMDEWGVDVVVTGSQKCLMVPPGLSFVAWGPGADQRLEKTANHRFYFDLRAYKASAERGETPFTPAVSLVAALGEALKLLEEEGLEASFERHRLMRDMARAAMKALDLTLFTEDRWASPTVTAVLAPDGVDVGSFRAVVRDRFGVELAGGQGDLKDRLFRIGHMGYAGPLDVVAAVAAVEQALKAVGRPVRLGAGVAAAQEVWAAWE